MVSRLDIKILFFIILWSSFQYFILGKYSFVLFGDELDSVFSHLMGNKFTDCSRCLWYPYAAAGTDQLSVGYTPDFDRLLVQLLPGWLAYQVRHVLQILAAVVGVFLICRIHLGLARPGAYFSAFVIGHWLSFSLFNASAIAFLPIWILSISWLLKAPKSALRWALALTATAFYATTAHINFFVGFPFIIIVVWFFVAEQKYKISDWLMIGLIFAVAIAFRAQDIVALLLNAPFSHRVNLEHHNLTFFEALWDGSSRVIAGLFNPGGVFSYVYNISFDIVPVLGPFVLLGAIAYWKTSRPVRLLVWTVLGLALAEILLPVFKYLMYDYLIPIRGFSINKLWLMSTFVAVIAAGVGYQRFYEWVGNLNAAWASPSRIKFICLFPVLVIILGDILEKTTFIAFEWTSQGNYVHTYESPVLKELAQKIENSGEPSRVSMYQMYESPLQGYGLETAGGMVVMYSKRYSDFWNKMYEPSFGIDPFADKIREYAAQVMTMGLTKSAIDKKGERLLSERYRLNFLSLANVKYIISRDKFTDAQLVLASETEPVKPWSEMGNWDKAKINLKGNFTGRTHINVYENTNVLPRFYLAENFELAENSADALNRMSDRTEDQLRRSVIVSAEDFPKTLDDKTVYSTDGTLDIVEMGADKIELKITSGKPALLVVGNSFSPYWVSRVDNVVVPIIPAYTTFWAVALPAGAQNVTFTYEPPYRLLN